MTTETEVTEVEPTTRDDLLAHVGALRELIDHLPCPSGIDTSKIDGAWHAFAAAVNAQPIGPGPDGTSVTIEQQRRNSPFDAQGQPKASR